MLTRNYTVLPATDTFIHEWNEPSCLYFPAAEHHRTLIGTHSRPTEVRRLSWPGWLVIYRGGIPIRRWSTIPSTNRPTDSAMAGRDWTYDDWVISLMP